MDNLEYIVERQNEQPDFLYESVSWIASGWSSIIDIMLDTLPKVSDIRVALSGKDVGGGHIAVERPGSDLSAATYPTMFVDVELRGSAWEEYPIVTQMFKPTISGVYKLKIRCGWYLTKSIAGTIGPPLVGPAYLLAKPLQMGLFLMRTPDGGMGNLAAGDVGALGDPDSKAILLSLTNPWVGGTPVTTPAAVKGKRDNAELTPIPALTTGFPGVEVLVEAEEGEEFLPYVGFLCKDADGYYDPVITCPSLFNPAEANDVGIFLWDPAIVLAADGTPCYTSNTSFGYELLDNIQNEET